MHRLGASRLGATDGKAPWQTAFLQSALIWGVLVTLSSEALSLFRLINRSSLALFWIATLLAGVAYSSRRGTLSRGLARLHELRSPQGLLDRILLGGIIAISAVLLLVALVAPPNNTDSLQYHMSRVAHWAQNGSLRHYASVYHMQLWSPPWAETAILHLRVLWGSDRPANLVQWFSMLASMVGASALARALGANDRGRLLAAIFALSIPMGMLQSTSTQNDYVTAVWLLIFALFVVETKRIQERWIWPALALGLALLTKGTAYPYAVPFLLWWILPGLIRDRQPKLVLQMLAVLAVVIGLNAGFWIRNLRTYGGPLGTSSWVQAMTNSGFGPGQIASSLINQIGLNFATPSEQANEWIVSAIRSTTNLLTSDSGNFRFIWSWNHEDIAGSPLHFLFVPIALALIFLKRRTRDPMLLKYSFAALASFIAFSSLVSFDQYDVRLQLAFLVLWSPVVGVAAERVLKPTWLAAMGGVLLIYALPWVLLNRSRPLVGWYPRTMTESILVEPPSAVLLANWPTLRDPYVAAASEIRDSECRSVGLRMDSHHLEYAFWWLLAAPQSGIRIEVIEPLQSLRRYLDTDFEPCAILCTTCSEGRDRLYGLDLRAAYDPVRLYMGEEFEWE